MHWYLVGVAVDPADPDTVILSVTNAPGDTQCAIDSKAHQCTSARRGCRKSALASRYPGPPATQ